jgi:transposase
MLGNMSKRAASVSLSAEELQTLRRVAAGRRTPVRDAQRARIILAAAEGHSNEAIAEAEGMSRLSVGLWRKRFADERLPGLRDRPRAGKPRTYTETDILRVIETACTQKPAAETHWSVRELARVTGVGRETVHRILKRADLKPHQAGTFSRSNDPEFVTKLVDVVGLYMEPPEHAIVLCVDEKTQVQALDRTQPMLPMRPGQIERRTHDYKRHGTVQLYAALEVHAGKVEAQTTQRHHSREFIAFLDHLLECYPEGDLHVILDNVSSHHSAEVAAWHAHQHNQRVTFHPIPTYSSWLNLVEVFFNLLQSKVVRRGNFHSRQELVDAMLAYIRKFSSEHRIFRWTKPAPVLLRKLNYVTGL